MATGTPEKKKEHEERQENAANEDATEREAAQYWGYMLKADKCGTPLLDRLLKGIAGVISQKFEPSDSPDLSPAQIAAFYRDVGGDYDVLFKDTQPASIAFIYRSLGAFHSLQPAPTDDGYSSPTVPALKKQGFVIWQTIQLLLGPEEHVPFLQRAVQKYDVVDPETGNIFPKVLPKQCFPDRPDEAMVAWYETVATRLRMEAEEESTRTQIPEEPKPRTSTDFSGDGSSADDKTGAFRYFEDPMYRKSRSRPNIMRHVSKQQAIYPMEDRGPKTVTNRVRHMLNPFSRKKKMPGQYDTDSYSDEDATPIATNPPATRYASHKRPHPQRRDHSPSSTDSDSDEGRPPSRRRTPDLRPRRSHEPVEPREYFPTYHEGERRGSHQYYPSDRPSSKATSPQPSYKPTTSPLFATQVAQMEARKYYDRRPTMPPRTSYRPMPQNGRYGSPSLSVSPAHEDAAYRRSHHEDHRDPSYKRDRHRERDSSYDGAGSQNSYARHRRRSTEDATYPREKERDAARTRSHDRVRDEWDERDSSKERRMRTDWDDRDDYGDRSRNGSRAGSRNGSPQRDRDRRIHRYVPSVQDGVSGRRYPVL